MTQEHDHQPALLNLADMTGPVSHDLRNVFNNMVLNTAILARVIPEELRSQVVEFRALALRANEMLTMLDHYRQKIVAVRAPLDLNEVVEEVVNRCQSEGTKVAKQTDPGLRQVWGNRADVGRLVELLVGACEAPIQVETPGIGAAVQLTAMGGPPPKDESLEQFFDPFGPAGSGQSHLKRAVCRTIAHRLGVPIRATSRDGKLAIVVEFEPADAG